MELLQVLPHIGLFKPSEKTIWKPHRWGRRIYMYTCIHIYIYTYIHIYTTSSFEGSLLYASNLSIVGELAWPLRKGDTHKWSSLNKLRSAWARLVLIILTPVSSKTDVTTLSYEGLSFAFKNMHLVALIILASVSSKTKMTTPSCEGLSFAF